MFSDENEEINDFGRVARDDLFNDGGDTTL